MNSDYERLTEALADEMFSSSQAGRPVYTLPDRQTLATVLRNAGVEGDDIPALAELVRSSLQIDETGVTPFHWQADAARRHAAQPLETPPALPLLVLLTIAAEQMHADSDVAAHNYYSRLHQILNVPSESRQRVEQDYRRNADFLWGSLNSWLEAWDGERGVPTAYAVGGHPFIGLPMSQAVVRQHDRGGLHVVFALEGMAPGLRMSPADMSSAMDAHATTAPSPLSSHIARLWHVAAARDRIVDAACLELEVWDGAGAASIEAGPQVASTRLLAFLHKFPRKSIEFNLMLPYRSERPGVAHFDVSAGKTSVPTIAGPGGSTRLSGIEGVSAASLVGEQLIGNLDEHSNRGFCRRPRRVTPLRWDDLQGAFVEVERIALGEDSLVLSRADARHRVESHLSEHARPGWHELPALPGMPEGWLLYEHVQVVSAPSAGRVHLDLLPLAPRTRTSLTLRGGFVLPGLLRKWSVLAPPEVVAVAAGAESIDVKVYRGTRIDADQVVASAARDGELVVLPLEGKHLDDGEYLATMLVNGVSRAASSALIRLRSANTPQYQVEDVDIRLVYSPESSPLWSLSAGPADWPRFVNGARTVGLVVDAPDVAGPIREFVPRRRAATTTSRAAVRVGIPMSSDSCLNTGMHRFQLPPVVAGQPRTRSIEGECTTCGLVRRFAGTPWAARRRDAETTRAVRPIEIPPVTETDTADFAVAFDALNHVGTGSLGALQRIAAQVEGSGLFADTFLRRLEVIGHIDVARDDRLSVTEWAVNSSTLVPIADGRWVLIGSRSLDLIGDIGALVGSAGQVISSVDAGLPHVELVGEPPGARLRELGVEVLAHSPAREIAAALPRLSDVAAALTRIVVPSYRSAEFWDTHSASWRQADSLTAVGSYRLKDFNSTYVIRSPRDIEDGTVGLANAQVAKHVANLWATDPLLGYHSRSGSVVTLLGADLPVLYGRALSLCSGRAPRQIAEHRLLQYTSIPREVADLVFDRLTQ